MARAKKEPTFIHSLRVNKEVKEFLKEQENANDFVLQLIKESNSYKEFLKSYCKDNPNQTYFNFDF